MPLENPNAIADLAQRIRLAKSYVESLYGQQYTGQENDVVFNGPVLWDTETQAQFEADNKELINRMRIVKQNVHRILKG